MMKTFLAAAAAFVLVNAAPAFAACPDCKDCPQHKVATAEKSEKKDATAAACKCAAETKGECKCAAGKCDCGHCHPKKEEPKKS